MKNVSTPETKNNADAGQSELSAGLADRVASLEFVLRTLLIATMPIRADGATVSQVSAAIPDLYDACHSASIVLMWSNAKVNPAGVASPVSGANEG